MSVKRRKGSKTYYTNFSHNGQRVRRSTGTTNKIQAQEYEDKLKERLWRQVRLGDRPLYTWPEAAYKYLQQNTRKSRAEIEGDKYKIYWLTQRLGDIAIKDITPKIINGLSEKLLKNKSPATANRYLAVLRTILNKAAKEWMDDKGEHYWVDKVPKITMHPEPKKRIRWLTVEEANRLIKAAPKHLSPIILFSLSTGLRKANVLKLEWSQIDKKRRHAWIHPDQAKSRKPIPVPLNDTAMEVLNEQAEKHPVRVFTYRGQPIGRIDQGTWKRCLAKAEIQNFKWHDLRHTWASWHVQNGTPLNILMELGGWSSIEMVLKYAHLAGEQLKSISQQMDELVFSNLWHKTGTKNKIKNDKNKRSCNSLKNNTEGGTRTLMLLPTPDFESGASTNSATSASG